MAPQVPPGRDASASCACSAASGAIQSRCCTITRKGFSRQEPPERVWLVVEKRCCAQTEDHPELQAGDDGQTATSALGPWEERWWGLLARLPGVP